MSSVGMGRRGKAWSETCWRLHFILSGFQLVSLFEYIWRTCFQAFGTDHRDCSLYCDYDCKVLAIVT